LDSQDYNSNNFAMGYLDVIPAAVFVVDADVRVLNYNRASALTFALRSDTAVFKRGGEALHCIHSYETPEGCGHGTACTSCVIRNSVTAAVLSERIYRKYHRMTLVSAENNVEIDCFVTVAPITYEGAHQALLVVEDVSEIFALRRLIPICAWCKKVRDDEDYWVSVEHYLKQQQNAKITHGVCPECAEGLKKEMEELRPGWGN